MKKYNKWDLIDKTLGSTLGEDNKLLLIELIRRCDYEKHGNWDCWPSVQRLAQVRGMKNERHFKGVDVYLPGLVDKRKTGRKNTYTIDPQAIMELEQFETVIKHTPAREVNTPAPAVNTPALEANTPAVEGANSTENSTVDSTYESTESAFGAEHAGAHSLSVLNEEDKDDQPGSLIGSIEPVVPMEGTNKDTPAVEGVSRVGQNDPPRSATQNGPSWMDEKTDEEKIAEILTLKAARQAKAKAPVQEEGLVW